MLWIFLLVFIAWYTDKATLSNNMCFSFLVCIGNYLFLFHQVCWKHFFSQGILLTGPPGTGKTLLAKVSFFYRLHTLRYVFYKVYEVFTFRTWVEPIGLLHALWISTFTFLHEASGSRYLLSGLWFSSFNLIALTLLLHYHFAEFVLLSCKCRKSLFSLPMWIVWECNHY